MGEEVEVWAADLDACGASVDEWERSVLSEDERRRAARIFDDAVRNRFIIARAVLRHLLASRLQLEPAELVFAYGPFGKPRLAAAGHGELHFNVSHADGWALIAISDSGRVGVDLERFQDIPEWEDMALACFPEEVRDHLNTLPADQRAAAFVLSWTRREALLKALGWGWAGSAVRCRAPFAPGLVVHDLPAPPGYAAAIARGTGVGLVIAHLWAGAHVQASLSPNQ